MSMIRVPLQPKPRKFRGTFGSGSGPVERIKRLQLLVTALVRHERIEGRFDRMDETRGYVEELINLAIRHGDRHKPTMEIADHWLLEKDLVHKLFKVLVPRYHKSSSSYTQIFRLPNKYELNTPDNKFLPFPAAKPTVLRHMSVLELKGNPYPPVLPAQRDTSGLLVNVLVDAAKNDFYRRKLAGVTHKQVDVDPTTTVQANTTEDIESEAQTNTSDEVEPNEQSAKTENTGTKT